MPAVVDFLDDVIARPVVRPELADSTHASPRLAWLIGQMRPRDRMLVELLLVRRLPYRTVAQAAKIPIGSVGRHRLRLVRIFSSPLVQALYHAHDRLDPLTLKLAAMFALQNTPVRQIARNTGLSYNLVRNRLDFLRGWSRAVFETHSL